MTLDSIFEVSIDVLNILWEEANNHSSPKHISFPTASCLKEIMSDVGQMADGICWTGMRNQKAVSSESPTQLDFAQESWRQYTIVFYCSVSINSLKTVSPTDIDLCTEPRVKARISLDVIDALGILEITVSAAPRRSTTSELNFCQECW